MSSLPLSLSCQPCFSLLSSSLSFFNVAVVIGMRAMVPDTAMFADTDTVTAAVAVAVIVTVVLFCCCWLLVFLPSLPL